MTESYIKYICCCADGNTAPNGNRPTVCHHALCLLCPHNAPHRTALIWVRVVSCVRCERAGARRLRNDFGTRSLDVLACPNAMTVILRPRREQEGITLHIVRTSNIIQRGDQNSMYTASRIMYERRRRRQNRPFHRGVVVTNFIRACQPAGRSLPALRNNGNFFCGQMFHCGKIRCSISAYGTPTTVRARETQQESAYYVHHITIYSMPHPFGARKTLSCVARK